MAEKMEKIWRAILCSDRFLQRDIVLLSGASRRYVKSTIKWLVEEGYVLNINPGDKTFIYQKTDKCKVQAPRRRKDACQGEA